MQYHICTSFGISKEYYGSITYKLGRRRQGNSVSRAICRDTSYLIFKHLEELNLGVNVIIPLSKNNFICLAIAFVDDTDFYTNDTYFNRKMQQLMDIYTRLYEAIGGKIQESKIIYYCWKWIYEKGVKKIRTLNAQLEVHNKVIEIVDISKSTRTLDVHITFSLNQKDQFEVMRKKLYISIIKLMTTDINLYQAVVYYNAYMIKSMYFGCGIIELSDRPE